MMESMEKTKEERECACHGTGHITESRTVQLPYDRGDGVIYGASEYSVRLCPDHPYLAPRVIL